MAKKPSKLPRPSENLQKSPTGIGGFDEITEGGLPQGRITLVTGGPGSGKTLFSIEFLVHGALDFDEPGLFVAFEETPDELNKNVAGLGFDLKDLEKRKKLLVDFIPIERSEIEETGDYDLEGLFIRLSGMIDSIGAKRVVLDTLEALFAGFGNELILRAELRRLFHWLKDKGVTCIVTAESGKNSLTRHSLEEYVSDCVIVFNHLVNENNATRRMRVIKYRGSHHGTNEYPFLIGKDGFCVLPLSSITLNYNVSGTIVSTGMTGLDAMFGKKGVYLGSSILYSGTAGTGKSSFAANFANSACERGERVLYLAFEESKDQIVRNMRSIGLDLEPWIKKGLLHFHNVRPTFYGLETHLAAIHDLIARHKPSAIILDPISNLIAVGSLAEVKSMLTRLIDYLKMKQITAIFTNLLADPAHVELTQIGISSLMDTWIIFKDVEVNGERNRVLHVIKSRGMAHSNQLREFRITDHGIEFMDVYIGKGQVLTGSARSIQEAEDQAERDRQQVERERKIRENTRKRRAIESQITVLQGQLESEIEAAQVYTRQEQMAEATQTTYRQRLSKLRQVDANGSAKNGGKKSGRR